MQPDPLTRRSLLHLGAGLGVGLGAAAGPHDQPGTGTRSVLVILVDQHRFDHAGFAGHPLASTPHLDALAAEAVRVESCYAAVPLCAPARQSFVTGLPASVHGTFRNRHAAVEGEDTVFHRLTAAGYHTAFVGKTHCNVDGFGRVVSQEALFDRHREEHPAARFAGEERIVTDRPVAVPFLEPYNPRLETAGEGSVFHMEGAVTEEVLSILRARPEGRPFFLTASYLAPHPPLFPPEEFLELYRGVPVEADRTYRAKATALPQDLRRRRRGQRALQIQDQQADNAVRAYLASLAWTDHCIGRLLEGLEQLGLSEDTLVVYTSDHGELLGQHGLFGKRAFYEGAARVPLLVRDPGRLPGGAVRDRVVSHLDLTATFLHWAGLETGALPGRDLRPLLRGLPELEWSDEARLESCDGLGLPEENQLVQPEDARPPEAMSWCLRSGPWKYMATGTGETELYDLREDPGEQRNLAADPGRAGVIAHCAARLREGSPARWAFHRTEDGREGLAR
jgi:arylsulfatase A-like enzyme